MNFIPKFGNLFFLQLLFLSLVGCSHKASAPSVAAPSPEQITGPSASLSDVLEKRILGYEFLKEDSQTESFVELNYFVNQLNSRFSFQNSLVHTLRRFPTGSLAGIEQKLKTSRETFRAARQAARAHKNTVLVIQNLKKLNFPSLQKVSFELTLAAGRKMSEPILQNISHGLLAASTTCASSAVYAGLGSTLESFFPDTQNFQLARDLYKQAIHCGSDESASKAAYRAAILSMLLNDCESASSFLDRASLSTEIKYLHSRTFYWLSKCKPNDGKPNRAIVSVYESYPLSYHGLLELQEKKTNLHKLITSHPEPSVQFRSLKNEEVNQLLRLAELLISAGKNQEAQHVLRKITPEKFEGLENSLLLYLAALNRRLEMGKESFQALAQALSRNPQLKSTSALLLFYPNNYFAMVEKYAKPYNLDPYLVMSVIRQESAFEPKALSPAKARGLMQLLPTTARHMDRRVQKDLLFDPETNIRLGTQYFAKLVERYKGNITFALAAYNAGARVVDNWLSRYPTEDIVLFMDVMPYRETREYVGSILRNWKWYEALYRQPDPASENPKIALQLKAYNRDIQ